MVERQGEGRIGDTELQDVCIRCKAVAPTSQQEIRPAKNRHLNKMKQKTLSTKDPLRFTEEDWNLVLHSRDYVAKLSGNSKPKKTESKLEATIEGSNLRFVLTEEESKNRKSEESYQLKRIADLLDSINENDLKLRKYVQENSVDYAKEFEKKMIADLKRDKKWAKEHNTPDDPVTRLDASIIFDEVDQALLDRLENKH